MKKSVKVIAGVVVGLGIVGSLAGGGGDKTTPPSTTSANTAAFVQTTKPAETKAAATKAPITVPPAPQATSGEKNALKTAESYLRYSAFSKKGLKDQIKFEGYSESESTYAVNNVNADWMEQAVKMAESYLKYSSFSKKGLKDQLIFEGFTEVQAEYGVSKAY